MQPSLYRLYQLRDDLVQYFSLFPSVLNIELFGSLARGDADAWSDIDLLLVIDDQRFSSANRDLLQGLRAYLPVLYLGQSALGEEPLSSHTLGIVFAEESVFHCLDMNFQAAQQYVQTGTPARFGPTLTLLERPFPPVLSPVSIAGVGPSDPDEQRLNDLTHFVRKRVKRFLRGQGNRDELTGSSQHLRDLLATYPIRYLTINGNPCELAERVLVTADEALAEA